MFSLALLFYTLSAGTTVASASDKEPVYENHSLNRADNKRRFLKSTSKGEKHERNRIIKGRPQKS